MRPSGYIIPLCCFLFSALPVTAQNNRTDSLFIALKNTGKDTTRVGTLNALCWELRMTGKLNEALKYGKEALGLSRELKWEKGEARALNNIGLVYKDKSEYSTALDHYQKALELDEKNRNKSGMAVDLGNMGNIFRYQGNYPKALDMFLRSLKLAEELGDTNRISIQIGNIGLVYKELGDEQQALEYYKKALEMAERLGDKNAIARHLGNMGMLYNNLGDKGRALVHFFRALQIKQELGEKQGTATNYGRIGIVYTDQGDSAIARGNALFAQTVKYPAAMTYYLKALQLDEELGNKTGIAIWSGNMGVLYGKQKKYDKAVEFLNRALIISQRIGYRNGLADWHLYLSNVYAAQNRHQAALEHYKKHITLRDSLVSEENTRKTVQVQMQYEFDKKQAADSIRNAEQVKQEALKHEQEIQRQKVFTYGGILGFSLMLLVAGVSFRAYRQKQKANILINQQKELVEVKQKEILDSIYYARRIQQSLLPSEKYIHRQLESRK